MTVADIRIVASELGYSISGSTKSALVTSFLSVQATQFSEVTPEGTENPKTEGWYESDGAGSFVATTDETVDAQATYYERTLPS